MTMVEGKNTHDLYNASGRLVAEGTLDYIGEKISVFSVYGMFDRENIHGEVRIESRLQYEEVYRAHVVEVSDNRVMVDGLSNISADLREDLKVEYRSLTELTRTSKESGETERFEARLENISGGGVCIVTDRKLERGEILGMKSLSPSLFLEIDINILRREEFGRMYKYGCRFHNISKLEESAIRKAVYRLQLEGRSYNRER